MKREPLVSIIMPAYNAATYLEEAVASVLAQTYGNWELLVVDDGSTDATADVLRDLAARDVRIKPQFLARNHGAAYARNAALHACHGDAIAYLDADDCWLPEKLERQLRFMRDSGTAMCFTSYETIRADGMHRNFIHVPSKLDHRGLLKNTVTCGHTMLFDTEKVNPEWLLVDTDRDFDFPDDLCAWLQVTKHGVEARGLDEVLAQYRKHEGSRSSALPRAVKRTWNQYRKIEGLSLPRAAHCLFWHAIHAVAKRL